jgi:predicted transcriptional regulator
MTNEAGRVIPLESPILSIFLRLLMVIVIYIRRMEKQYLNCFPKGKHFYARENTLSRRRLRLNMEIEKRFLHELLERAVSRPKSPWMGFRELCRKTKTSTKTLHKYLPYLIKSGYIGEKTVGEYRKLFITPEGKHHLDALEQHLSYAEFWKKPARHRDYLLVDFAEGHATINFEPGTLHPRDEEEIRHKASRFLRELRRDYPNKRFYMLFSSPPGAWGEPREESY